MFNTLLTATTSQPQAPQLELAVLLFLLLIVVLSLAIFALLGYRSANVLLQKAEQRQRVVMDTLSDGLITLDERRLIRQTNRAVEDMFGWKNEELLGRSINVLLPESGQTGQPAPPPYPQQEGVPLARQQVLQAMGQQKNGHFFPVHLSFRRIELNGQPHYVAIVSDASQVMAFQNSALTARSELGSFVAALSEHSIFSETDLNGDITQANAAFCEISGYREDELLGRSHNIVNAKVHPPAFWADMWRTVRAGRAWHGEICNRAKNGQLYWVDSLIAPVLNTDGTLTRIVSIRHDITQRKNYEYLLLKTQQMLEITNQAAGIGTWEYDIANDRATVSPVIRTLLGISVDEPLDRGVWMRLIQRSDIYTQSVDRALLTGQGWDLEVPLHTPSGALRWMRSVGMADWHDGRCVRLYGIAQDITHIKQREEDLANEKQRLSNLIDSNRIGTWEYNLQTQAWQCNLHWAAMLGLSLPEASVMSDSKLDQLIHPDDVPQLSEVAKMPPGRNQGSLTFRMRHVNGSWIWVQSHYTVLKRDAQGLPLVVYGANFDVTELMQARLEAESAVRSKDQFLSTMSHELRTPMNAILGFSQLLEIDEELNDDQRDSVQEILKASHHLLDLINDVLDLAKINAGRMDLNLEPVSVSEVLSDCSALILPLSNARQLTLELPQRTAFEVLGDRVRLKQVLLNLLSNAVKYNQAGGKIRVALAPSEPHSLRLSVSDTGLGIAPEDIPRVFQPFSRLEGINSEIEGTGIGLSISQQLVEKMGGRIGLDSQLGVGSTFWFEVPLAHPVQTPI